jgi:hypothetical protein
MLSRGHWEMVAYALDQLGWLQFEQLCSRLLELDCGVPAHAWAGAADRCRHVLCGGSIGTPLLPYELPGPVLVHCAWIRPGVGVRVPDMAARLAIDHFEDLAVANSYLLMCNADLREPLDVALGDSRMQVGIAGGRGLSSRIDALPELRLAMPSVLGLRALAELIDEPAREATSLDLDAAAELAGVFVPTRAHERALRVLGEHHFAVLTGPPEMGKTAIARMVALAQMTAGWEAHECTTPEDVWRAFRADRPQVFVADDAFGSTEYRADAAERWAREMERLLRSLDDRHWLIWTSRPAPLQAGLRRLHRERGAERFPSPARVLVDAGDLDPMEKTLILFRHAKAAGLPRAARSGLIHHGPVIVEAEHFTPERIRRLVARMARGERDVVAAADEELRTPTEAMAVSFRTLEAEHRDLLLALLDTPPGPAVAERELVAALRRHHDGSLLHPPGELVDRLSDHFLKVVA